MICTNKVDLTYEEIILVHRKSSDLAYPRVDI